MDATRGFAVLLVVAHHSATNTRFADVRAPEWLFAVDQLFAPVRMPTLVFLSGLLLAAGLRKGPAAFLRGKAKHLLWPYLVWVAVYFVISYPVYSVPGFLLGGTILWYLLFLLIYYVAALLLQRVPVALVIGAALVGSALLPDASKYGERLLFLFAFFMAGHWCANHPRAWEPLLQRRSVLVGAVAVAAASVLLVASGALPASPTGFGPRTLLLNAASVLLLVRLARLVGEARFMAPVRFVGRHSIVYYVTHFPVVYVLAHIIGRVTDLPGGAVFVTVWLAALLVATAWSMGIDRHPRGALGWPFAFPLRLSPRASS